LFDGDVDTDGGKLPSIVGLPVVVGWFEGISLGIVLSVGATLGSLLGHMLIEG